MKINTDTTIIPNFFKKEHIESLIGRKITKKEFREIKEVVEEELADEVSNLVREEIAFIDALKYVKGEGYATTLN